MSFGSPTPIEVAVTGANLSVSRAYAEKLKAEMQKIAALRRRLDGGAVLTPETAHGSEALQNLEDRVQRGALHNSLIETAIRGSEVNDPTTPTAPPVRLTARGKLLADSVAEVFVEAQG